MADSYEKDKLDTEEKIKQAIDIYNQENEALKKKLAQKTQDYAQLALELEHFRNSHSDCSSPQVNHEQLNRISNECSDLRARSQLLEKEVGDLSSELVAMDTRLKEKDDYILELED